MQDTKVLSESFSESLTDLSFRKWSATSLRSRLSAVDSPVEFKGKRKKKKKEKKVVHQEKTVTHKLQDFTGLHRICFSAKGEFDPLWKFALQLFEHADGEESRKIAESEQNGLIPLFLACERQPPTDVVKVLINAFPESLDYRNESFFTCLHVACKFNASYDVLRLLVERHPYPDETIQSVNKRNETPLILWMYSNDCKPPPLPIFKLLLSPKAMRIIDEHGNNPFQLICDSIYHKDGRFRNQEDYKENIKQLFDTYLDTEPYGTSQFMREVAQFPSWLQDHVSNHSQLRHILNFRISQKLTTAVLMFDLFIRTLIILSFTNIMIAHSNNQHARSNGYITALIFSTIYLSFREALQLISFPFFNYITDLWNWLDAIQIISLSICTHAFLRNGIYRNNEYDTIIAFTSCLIWLTMASFLRSLYLPFSVMIMGMIHVAKVLAPFLVATFCLLSSFSLVFFSTTVVKNDTIDSSCVEKSDFCTYGDATANTLSLFVGFKEVESIKDELNTGILAMFMTISSILLLNVVIAIINDSFGDIAEEAEKLFWNNRFYFVSEIESVRNFLLEDSFFANLLQKKKKKKRKKDYEQIHRSMKYHQFVSETNAPENVNSSRLFFDILKSSLKYYDDEDERITTENFFKRVNNGRFSWIVEAPLLLRRVCAIIVFPMWILVGFCTFGWLWPPQVREFFLCPVIKSNMDEIGNKTKAYSVKSSRNITSIDAKEDDDLIFKEQVRTMMEDIRLLKDEISYLRTNNQISKDTIDDLKTIADVMK